MSTALKRTSPTEYLDIDRASEARYEYYFGEVIAMSGGSHNHSLISMNIGREVGNSLKGTPCYTLNPDMRVKTATGVYTHPDATVVCGEPQFDDGRNDVLLNPSVIFEVLSPSTEDYDRGKKLLHYRSIPSLKAYLLVSQDLARVECFSRNLDRSGWLLTEVFGVESVLQIPSLGIELRLSDAYDRVVFPRTDAAD